MTSIQWPLGFTSAGGNCGIKASGTGDLGVLVAEIPVQWAGTFTLNAAAAAPVLWSKAQLGKLVRAIVVNSGNANACTGLQGEEAVLRTVKAASKALSCSEEQILVASTGPIGVPLPVEKITAALPRAIGELSRETEPFAKSIMTTDTKMKIAVAKAGEATIVGVAKGAAMLAPNMATMLAFIATDARLPEDDLLAPYLRMSVRDSFNLISVDACESTNDSVFVLASALVAATAGEFSAGLRQVTKDLARQMVEDAEGGTRVMRIRVTGTIDPPRAARLAHAVAASALWRAALHGGDPNWGRVLSAIGSEDRELDMDGVTVSIGGVRVFDKGSPTGRTLDAAAEMKGAEVLVEVEVGTGTGEAEVLASDLSPAYVLENATGTS